MSAPVILVVEFVLSAAEVGFDLLVWAVPLYFAVPLTVLAMVRVSRPVPE